MTDFDKKFTKVPEEQESTTFTSTEVEQVSEPALEPRAEVDGKKLWTDDDILQHVLGLVNAKLQESRAGEFKAEVTYSELRLITEAVNIAINRTEFGNQLVNSFSQRAEAVKELAARIASVVEVKLS